MGDRAAPIRLGVVGAGMIGGAMCRAAQEADEVVVVAVASRRLETAEQLAREHGVPRAFATWQELVTSDEIDAVYVATPTSVREQVCLGALAAGKHVLGDKPFVDAASAMRIAEAAQSAGLAFMDATHFTHHERTAQIKAKLAVGALGSVRGLRSAFFFPSMDRTNIRMDPSKEPSGAVGDMAWYSMRAVVEYLGADQSEVVAVHAAGVKDAETGALVRGSGFLQLEDGRSSTFDFGYDVGACLMDLDIMCERGVYRMNDFVLDLKSSFAFQNPDAVVGYTELAGLPNPTAQALQRVEDQQPQAARMLGTFAGLCRDPKSVDSVEAARRACATQGLVDRVWGAMQDHLAAI